MSKRKKIWLVILAVVVTVFSVFQIPYGESADSAIVKVLGLPTGQSAPRNDDGTIDFAAVYNDQHVKNVPIEDNFAFDLYIASGCAEQHQDLFSERIENPLKLLSFEDFFYQYLSEQNRTGRGRSNRDSLPTLDGLDVKSYVERLEEPWSGDEFPLAKMYLEVYKANVELIRSGVAKSRYASPTGTVKHQDYWHYKLSEALNGASAVFKLMTIVAMNQIGEAHLDECLETHATVLKTASLMQLGHAEVDHILSTAVRIRAFQIEYELLNSNRLSHEQCQKIRQTISGHTIDSGSRCFNTSSLYIALNTLIQMEQGRSNLLIYSRMPVLGKLQSLSSFGAAVERTADWFAKYGKICETESVADRMEAYAKLEQAMMDLDRDIVKWYVRVFSSAQSRGELIGDNIAYSAFPGRYFLRRIADSEIRNDVADTAFAIEQFRISKKRLPESLIELVPDFIAKIPLDKYSQQPLVYRPSERGYYLYSLGVDQVDQMADWKLDRDAVRPKTDNIAIVFHE